MLQHFSYIYICADPPLSFLTIQNQFFCLDSGSVGYLVNISILCKKMSFKYC